MERTHGYVVNGSDYRIRTARNKSCVCSRCPTVGKYFGPQQFSAMSWSHRVFRYVLHGMLEWGASGLDRRCFCVSHCSCAARVRSFANWKRQHLSTDNLSFVAGLRGRPIVPAPDPRQKKVRRQPKAVTPKGDVDEVCTRRTTCIEQVQNIKRYEGSLPRHFVPSSKKGSSEGGCRTEFTAKKRTRAGVKAENTLPEDKMRQSQAPQHSHPRACERRSARFFFHKLNEPCLSVDVKVMI